MLFHTDCREYRADRPCRPHKESGAECAACTVYDPVSFRILIIKLGAMGDVLRTTSLLEPLHRTHPGCSIDWMTRAESVDLIKGTVDRVLLPDGPALAEIQVREYDLVINLDLARDSAALASLARGRQKRGYLLAPDGSVFPCDERGRTWYEMSLHDGLKKSNAETYQSHMLAILGLDPPVGRIVVQLGDADRATARAISARHRLEGRSPVVGLNIGAGGRWRWKAWTPEGFADLARRLHEEWSAEVLLLYGPEEGGIRDAILRLSGVPLIDTGGANPIRQFMGIVDLCDLVITGDTLALHVALGLGKRVAGLFGPTSIAEIEMYELGEKLAGNVPCLGCYLNNCDVRPSCMESLSPDAVFAAAVRALAQLGPGMKAAHR